MVLPQTGPLTTAIANGGAYFCSMQSSVLAPAGDYGLGKTAFKSNEMGVVLEKQEVNDHSNFVDFHFT